MSCESLETELGKLKSEHLSSVIECRRLERELEVKNDELKELTKKLGFSEDAEAKAIKRYGKTMEHNKELESKLRESMSQKLPWDIERHCLELKVVELDDLVTELKYSENAKARVVEKCKLAWEYNLEVDAKLEDLKRIFNEERLNFLGKLTETETELANLKDKIESNLKGNESVDIGGNSNADPTFESHINYVKCPLKLVTKCDETAKATAISEEKLVRENRAACDHKRRVKGIKRARASSSIGSTHKHIDDSSSAASDYQQHPEQSNMVIYLKANAQTGPMVVDPSLTIDSLKSKIHDILGIPPHKQRLSFVGTLLEDNTHTLAQHHIQKESTIECSIYPDRSPVRKHSDDSSSDVGDLKQDTEQTNVVKFFVETICGMTLTAKFDSSLTIGSLKSKIEDELYIQSRHQVLAFEGKYLKDKRTLAHYGIKKDSTIYILVCRI